MRLLAKIKAHPAVDWVSQEPGGYFVYLKPGWNWSEQTSFGTETLSEAWKLVLDCRRDTL